MSNSYLPIRVLHCSFSYSPKNLTIKVIARIIRNVLNYKESKESVTVITTTPSPTFSKKINIFEILFSTMESVRKADFKTVLRNL